MRRLIPVLLGLIAFAPTAAFTVEAKPSITMLEQLESSSDRPLRVSHQGSRLSMRGFVAGPYAGDPARAARAFLDEHAAMLPGAGGSDWSTQRLVPMRNHTAVHLQQQYCGLPVIGGEAMLKVGRDGTVEMITVSYRPGITVDTTPAVPAQQAVATALATLQRTAAGTPVPRLQILPDRNGGRLVYRLLLSTRAPVDSWRITVDANTGEVLEHMDLKRSASGWAFEQNPDFADEIEVELTDLAGDASVLDGTYAVVQSTVFDGENQGTEHLAVADEEGDFFYLPVDPAVDDPFVEVQAYYHVTKISRFFEDELGHEFSGPALVTTNYRSEDAGTYDNAYYTPDMMGNTTLTFGQGASYDYAYDADVVVHEFGHAVIQERTNMVMDFITYDDYGWNNAPGGIHEGLADYWACSTHDDPVVGEYTISRTLDNDHTCPEDLTGEVHDDGEFVGATAWDIYQAVGKESADVIVYGALGLVTSAPSFAELGEAMSEVAADLVDDGILTTADAEAIDGIIQDRGMARCGRSLPMEDGVAFEYDVVHVMGMPELPAELCQMGRDMGIVFATQYQFALATPPADQGPVEGIELQMEVSSLAGPTLGEDDLMYTFFVREGELVTFDYLSVEVQGGFELQVPSGDEFDVEFPDEPLTITLTADDIELKSDTTYYFGMTHMNCPAVRLTLTPQLTLGDPPADDDDDDDDALDDDDTDDGGDCSCSSADRRGAGGGLMLLGWAAFALRRRR